MTELLNKDGAGRNKHIPFWLFLLVYAAFIIYLCKVLNIWIDEVYTMDTSSYSLSGVINQSYNFEGQPPAFFIFLSLWRTISSDLFFARLFSVACIGIAAWVFYKLVVLISGKDCSLWFVVLFLLNPYTVWASTQARLYAFLLLLSIVSVYFFFNFYKKRENKYLIAFWTRKPATIPIVVGRLAAQTPSFLSVRSSILDATTNGGAHYGCRQWL